MYFEMYNILSLSYKETCMDHNPLDIIKVLDAALFDTVSRDNSFTFKEGALDTKTKYLIALALDAAHGAANGVKALTLQALKHGAEKEEILEAVHVANYISGVGSVYTAAAGLAGVFET